MGKVLSSIGHLALIVNLKPRMEIVLRGNRKEGLRLISQDNDEPAPILLLSLPHRVKDIAVSTDP
jgi:hypothetical protein